MLSQQQGLPVTFLCRLICDSAWHKYVVRRKRERGVVEKVHILDGCDTCIYPHPVGVSQQNYGRPQTTHVTPDHCLDKTIPSNCKSEG